MPVSGPALDIQLRKLQALFPAFAGNDPFVRGAFLRAFELACDNDQQARDIGDYLERTLRQPPVPADIHAAAEALAEQRRSQQELDSAPPNPFDALIGQHWFYEIITAEHIERARQWTTGPDKYRRKLGEQILAGVEARRGSMPAGQWDTERRQADYAAIHAQEMHAKRGRR